MIIKDVSSQISIAQVKIPNGSSKDKHISSTLLICFWRPDNGGVLECKHGSKSRSKKLPMKENTPFDFKIVAINSNITVFVNGKEFFNCTAKGYNNVKFKAGCYSMKRSDCRMTINKLIVK